jgi:hypothetical protein
MAVATDLSFLGIAKEAVRGTVVAPTVFIPVKTITPLDEIKYLQVNAFKGAMAEDYGEVPGPANSTFEVGGPLFVDTFPWFLGGLLGDLTTLASRTVADGATTNASQTVTSATANFTQNDVGRPISGTNIPAGATIASVTNATTATISVNATGTGSALSITIGAVGLFSNIFALLNSGQPTSHTVTDFYGVTQARSYPGTQWQEVEVKFTSDGLLEYTAKGTGWPSSQVAKPAASFSTVLPLPAWTGTVTIGGTVVVKLMEGTFTFTRKVEKIFALDGLQGPTQIFLGTLGVKGKVNLFVDDDTELTRYLTNTQPSFDVSFVSGSGASLQQVRLHFNQAAYVKAQPNRSKIFTAVDVEFNAVANATDVGSSGGFSPTKAFFQNAINGGYV